MPTTRKRRRQLVTATEPRNLQEAREWAGGLTDIQLRREAAEERPKGWRGFVLALAVHREQRRRRGEG